MKVKNVYVDSNVIISSKLRDENTYKDSKRFIDFILKNKFQEFEFWTSRFTGVELSTVLMKRRKNPYRAKALIFDLEKGWKNKVFLLPPNPNEKIKVGEFVDKLIKTSLCYPIRFSDLIHLFFAIEYEMDYIVTWNISDFKILEKKLNVKVLTPTEMIDEIKRIENK